MNIFETATRQKLRFATDKGNLTVEQLWDLPLTSTKGLSLNSLGIGIQRALREMGEDNLVDTGTKDPERELASVRLDVIKHIINVRQEENAKSRKAVELKAEKEKLTRILHEKQEAGLKDLSEDEIKQRIAAM